MAVPPELVPDTDDDAGYFTHPLTGRRYKHDEYGENVRKTGRPPYISVADYKKMSYRQQLKAKLEYQVAQDASIIHPNKGGSHTSALPKPATSCPTAAPMGIFGLLLKCKSAEAQVAAAEEHGYATEAPETDDDDVKSHHDGIDTAEDNFNDCGFVPASTDEGIPIMPTVRSQGGHNERNPPFMAPFNAAVARTVGRK